MANTYSPYPVRRPQHPDDALVVVFKTRAEKNPTKSDAAGRDIYDDVEICEIRIPGSKDIRHPFPTEVSHWEVDPQTGGQRKVTYAERFSYQYQQFKAKAVQTKSGTPLEIIKFLTEARKAELRAMNVYTVEQLAGMDGQELKNLGPYGREYKNAAQQYIEEAKANVPAIQMAAALEAKDAKLMAVESELEILKTRLSTAKDEPDSQFGEMSNDQIKDYIAAQGGQRPLGNPNRKTLIRMAIDANPHSGVL